MRRHHAYRAGRFAIALALTLLACRDNEPPPAPPSPPAAEATRRQPGPASTPGPAPTGQIPIPPTPFRPEEVPSTPPTPPPTPPIPPIRHPSRSTNPLAPLADAKVGEWARYATEEHEVVAYRLLRIEAQMVHIETQMLVDGQPLGRPAVRAEPLDCDPIQADADRVGADVVWEDATVEAAGRAWPCRLATMRWVEEEVQYVRRTWYAEAAPIYGTVKLEMSADGQRTASLVLIDHGEP